MAEKYQDRLKRLKRTEKLVAKVNFWFGKNEPIFDKSKYDVEYDGEFATIYKK